MLSSISFPVYKIPDWYSRLDTKIYLQEGEEEGTGRLIDDLSLPGDTLGKRRLAASAAGVKLYNLKNAIFYIKDLVILSNGADEHYIDSKGKVFKYTKTSSAKLICKKITKVIPITTGGALLELDKEYVRYKVMYAPNYEQYAGLLEIFPHTYILYGIYEDKFKNSWRKF
jgi:hypothetical protein